MAKRIPTLSTNQQFRDALTEQEAMIYDAVRANGFLSATELWNRFGITRDEADEVYASAQDKFLQYATRSEM